jgi:formylglycine-generating enzyme required for sulfatase activity
MKKLNIPIKTLLVGSLLMVTMTSCKLLGIGGKNKVSSSTGAEYATDKDLLGYRPYNEQELPSPPGMVFVQGGRTVLGSFEQDLYGSRDNIERTVTVSSFFMDETERTNGDWKEYVHHQFNPMDLELPKNIEVVDPYSDDYLDQDGNPSSLLIYTPSTIAMNGQSNEDLIPNDNVWESQFAFNSVYAKNYYSNPGFNDYPVVGITWRQVRDFCVWRTDFVNLNLIMEIDPADLPEDFSNSFFTPTPGGDYKLALNGSALTNQEAPNGSSTNDEEEQRVSMDDFFRWQQAVIEYINIDENETKFIERGIYLPDFRLPNEAEWEYAAKATIGTVYLDENEEYGRIYPWDGRSTRNPYGKKRGEQLANFKRGRGDYAGIAGGVNNDGSMLPESVGQREPNDFNLFNMAGNVSEWVYDTYRPLAFSEFDDMNPVRKSLGDEDQSDPQTYYDWQGATEDKDKIRDKTLNPGQALTYRSLVNDRARVFKGGSWKDVAYWMAPGTRRFLDMDEATNTIGFRCAMISIGTQQLDGSNGLFGGR